MLKTPTSIFHAPDRTALVAIAVAAALAIGAILFGTTAGNAAASQVVPTTPFSTDQTQEESTTPGGAYVHVPAKSRDNADWYQFVLYENGNQVTFYNVHPVLPKSSVRLIGSDPAAGHTIACGTGTADFRIHAWKHGPNRTSIRIRQTDIQQFPVRPCDTLHVDFDTQGGGADVRVPAKSAYHAEWYRFTLQSSDGHAMHDYDIRARSTVHYVTVGDPDNGFRLPCDGGPHQQVSSSGARKANFFVTAWSSDAQGNPTKLSDVGYQLSPVHPCPIPDPSIGPFTESVSGPYVVAVIADEGFTEPDGELIAWNVPMIAVADQTGTLNYADLNVGDARRSLSFPARSEGDLLDWGVLDGYVVRVNLSELVDSDVDLSDPEVCDSYRVVYQAQGQYRTSSGLSWANTRVNPAGYQAEVFGCNGIDEASPEEARVMVPFLPLDAFSPVMVSHTHFKVELQRVDSSGNRVGPVYTSGDYGRRSPDGTRMELFDKWWMAFSVPYDGNPLGLDYSDCYGLRLKARVIMHYGPGSNQSAYQSETELRPENCWRAPLSPAKSDLNFPVTISWDPVEGADGYMVAIAQAGGADIETLAAYQSTSHTFQSCSPSGDDNVMRIEVRPYVLPLVPDLAQRVESPGVEIALPCPIG